MQDPSLKQFTENELTKNDLDSLRSLVPPIEKVNGKSVLLRFSNSIKSV
jgi:hypothetical protein